MTAHRVTRICAALALAAGAATGVSTMAGPSSAAATTCTPVHVLGYYSTPPTSIAGQYYLYCDGFRDYLTMTIYKYESGTWVAVASGPGHASYLCNGTASNMYKDQSGDQVTAPCV